MRTYDQRDVVITFGGMTFPGKIGPVSEVETDDDVGPFEAPEATEISFTVEIPCQSFLHAFCEPVEDPRVQRDLEGSWLWQ